MRRGGQLTKLDQGRKQIDRFNQSLTSSAGLGHTGNSHHQRHAGALLKKRHLAPHEMFTQVIAVVGGENNNRVIPKFLLFQLIKDQPDLRIHKRNAGVVGLRVLAPERIVLPA